MVIKHSMIARSCRAVVGLATAPTLVLLYILRMVRVHDTRCIHTRFTVHDMRGAGGRARARLGGGDVLSGWVVCKGARRCLLLRHVHGKRQGRALM